MSSPLTAAIVHADECYQRLLVPHDDHEALLATTREAIRRVDVALRLDATPTNNPLHNKCQWQWDRMKPKITTQMKKVPEPKTKPPKRSASSTAGVVLHVESNIHADRLREVSALSSDVAALHDIQTEFGALLHRDGAALSVALDDVERADHDAAKGVKELGIASSYKLAGVGMAVTGAVVGAIVGGPVGLLVGIKSALGVVVCVGAGAATGALTTTTVGGAVYASNVKCIEAAKLGA